MEVLSYLLSIGQGTRLDDPLYFISNLTNSIGTYYFSGDLEGLLVFATTTTKPLKVVLKHIDKQLNALVKTPPSQDEVNRAQKAIRSYMLSQLESPRSRANLMVDCYRYTEDPNCLANDWARYEAVTPEDVLRVAETYLLNAQRTTLSVVPKGEADSALDGATNVELP